VAEGWKYKHEGDIIEPNRNPFLFEKIIIESITTTRESFEE
jgi:hypothetical protein